MAGDRQELEDLRRLAELEAKAGQPAPVAPPTEPTGIDRLRAAVQNGMIPAGPQGLIANMVGKGLSKANEALDLAAYKTGGAITDAATKFLPAERTQPTNLMEAMKAPIPTAPELGFAANVALQAAPTLLGGETAKLAAPAMESGARTLMQSAVKPSDLARVGGKNSDWAKALQTMFDEGITVSQAGLAKAREKIDQLHGQVAQLVQDAAKNGATVDKGYVGSEIYKTLQKFRNQLNSGADEAAILKSWQETNAKLAAKIPVLEAQSLKQGTYRTLAEKYAKGGTPAIENEAATQAQMAGARGLRIGLEDAIPGVGKINERESKIINAIEIASKREGTAGNRDMGGIAFLASNPKAAAAMMLDRSPAFKSWLAQQIYKYQSSGPANAARASIGLYESELGRSPPYEVQK